MAPTFKVTQLLSVSAILVFLINGQQITSPEPTLSSYPTGINNITFASDNNDFELSTSDDSKVTVSGTTNQTLRPRQRSGYGFDASIIHSGTVSEGQFNTLKSVTRNVMLVVPVLGIGFNCFNIIIFSRPQMGTASSRMLVCLSAAELASATLKAVSVFVEAAYGDLSLHTSSYLYIVIFFSIYGITVISRTTFCYILFISGERLLAVVFPLKARHIKLIQKPVITFIAILIFVAVYHVNLAFKFDVVSYETAEGETHYKFARSSSYLNYRTLFDILVWVADIVFVFIPLFGCLILNVILSIALRHHHNLMKKMSSTQDPKQMNRADKQITVTILVSSVVFTLLVLPVQLMPIIVTVIPDYRMYAKEHFLFLFVTDIKTVLNQVAYCTNFICYYALGGRFRKTFHAIFCHYRPGTQQQANLANEQPSGQTNLSTIEDRSRM